MIGKDGPPFPSFTFISHMIYSTTAAVLFYETENGSVPVQAFIESLPAKHGAKVYWEIGLLEKEVPMKTWAQVKKDLLKDPEFAKEVKKLEPEYQIISQLIKTRIEQNLTQEDLARKIGTKQGNISRLEKGNANPSLQFLKKVARGLGKELSISFTTPNRTDAV